MVLRNSERFSYIGYRKSSRNFRPRACTYLSNFRRLEFGVTHDVVYGTAETREVQSVDVNYLGLVRSFSLAL